MGSILGFLGLGKMQAIAIGALLVLLAVASGGAYVLSLKLDSAQAKNAMLKRDVDEAVRANQSLVDQVATERSALALARELAAEYRRHRDDAQDRADSLDKQIREAPRAPTSDQCRAACRADPGVWRSITGPAGGVR
jgi:hypothetical protein